MLNPEINPAIAARLKTLQIIAMSLIMGVGIFAGVAAYMAVSAQANQSATSTPPPTIDIGLFRIIGGALLLGGCSGAFFILMQKRPAAQANVAEQDPEMVHFGRFFTTRIAAYAMLEAPALFGAITVLLGGNLADLVFVAVPLTGMLLLVPTQDKWEKYQRDAASVPMR